MNKHIKHIKNSGEAVIEDGCIVIRVPIEVLPNALKYSLHNHALTITDLDEFAKDVVYAMNDGGEGDSPVHHLFDAAMEQALEGGCLGVEY